MGSCMRGSVPAGQVTRLAATEMARVTHVRVSNVTNVSNMATAAAYKPECYGRQGEQQTEDKTGEKDGFHAAPSSAVVCYSSLCGVSMKGRTRERYSCASPRAE